MPAPILLLCCLLACLVPLRAASAASYDPDLRWRTITTEHFHIHFHQGEEQLAEEFIHVVEDVFAHMNAELQWTPRRRTELVLVDRTDVANGYAQGIPYNTIVIYVTAPQEDSTLGLYQDWNTAISMHEYTHIVHLDTNHGLVRAARAVVGRIASTNQLSPPWMIEGLATFQETRQTPGGRGRSRLVDMIKRTAVVEQDFPPLGNLDGLQPDPPGGNLRYLFGQDFIQYIADHTGRDAWTDWIHTYGSSVPYLLPARKVFGRRLVPLYQEWKRSLEEHYGAQAAAIEAEGVREGRILSTPEASCSAPSFSPDGQKLVWSCYDLRTGSALWLADGQGEDPSRLKQDYGAKNFTWRRDSEAVVFAAIHTVNRFNSWSDIYMLRLEDASISALTQGARARDPEFSPDGARLLVVTNRAQDTNLEVLTVDQRQVALTDYEDHRQISTPRYAPDGRSIAVSMWQDGRRDLWLLDPQARPLRRLTADVAVDRDPEWSADGRWLYFSSDRSGVPNIYALEIATERLFQVTNVRTGAARPSVNPDGTRLAYEQYSADGWDVRLMELDPSRFLDRGQLPRDLTRDVRLSTLVEAVELSNQPAPLEQTRWFGPEAKPTPPRPPSRPLAGREHPLLQPQAPGEVLDTFDQAEVEDAFGEERDYPFSIEPHRYTPWATLLPRFWLPYVQTTPYAPRTLPQSPWGLKATALAYSADTLRHALWSASAHYRTDADFFGWSADFTYNRFLPVFTIGASRFAVPYTQYLWSAASDLDGDGVADEDELSTGELFWQSRTRAYLFASYPYTFRTTIFGQYSLTRRAEHTALSEEAYLPLIPVRGTIGTLQAGWRYAWSQQTAMAISLEDGRTFSLIGGLTHPWLGTRIEQADGEPDPLTQVQLTSELREYLVMPFAPNHVLAMRAAGGITVGATDYLGYYQLGGSFGDGATYVTPDEFRMLRGYPIAADNGDRYWLGGVEYRFPVVRFDRGWGTIPLFLRYLSANAFVDAGNAFSEVEDWTEAFTRPLIGVGAELRLAIFVGWSTGLTGRLGYAVGLTEEGFAYNEPGALYFQLGGSF